MSSYDLRYTKAPSENRKKPKVATSPYRLFPWENTSFSLGLGFDYSPELGIIATGSSNSECLPTFHHHEVLCALYKPFHPRAHSLLPYLAPLTQ